MTANRPSITAQSIALVRTLESRKPADERICFDPLAHLFVHLPLLRLDTLLHDMKPISHRVWSNS